MSASQEMPEISVIICTRNRRSWLGEAVASLQAQRGVSWELILVDDASTDDTWEYCQSLASPVCRCLRQETAGGRAAAAGRGLSVARGRAVMFLDDDDWLAPDSLRHLSHSLRSGVVAAVGARWDAFCDGRGGGRRDSHPWFDTRRNVFLDLLFGWSAVSGQNLYLAEAVRQIGSYRAGFWPCDDRDLWLRLARLGEVQLLPQLVMRYRVHSQQFRPPDLLAIRERVYRAAIRASPREERRRALRVRAASRFIQAAESALERGEWLHAAQFVFAEAGADWRIFLSPLVGPWVLRRLSRRIWHRLRSQLRAGFSRSAASC